MYTIANFNGLVNETTVRKELNITLKNNLKLKISILLGYLWVCMY